VILDFAHWFGMDPGGPAYTQLDSWLTERPHGTTTKHSLGTARRIEMILREGADAMAAVETEAGA